MSMSTTPSRLRSSAVRLALLGTTMAFLAGCGNDMDALQAKVDEIKNAPGTGSEPLPEVKPYETFDYAAADQRAPFEPGSSVTATSTTGVRPDAQRPREFLE